MKLDLKIPFRDLARIECHVAASRTTAQAVQAQTGADLVFNTAIFDLRSGSVLSRMTAGGKRYGTASAPAWGLEFPKDAAPARVWDNGRDCPHYLAPYSYAVVDGEVRDGLRDNAKRGRMLLGITPDSLVVLGFDDGDASRCSTAVAGQAMQKRGCTFAMNLDGGASVQWAGRFGGCKGQRKVPAFLCVYLKKSEPETEDVKLRAIATKKQSVYTASGAVESGRYIDKNDACEVGSITQNLLIPVTYPTGSGPRKAYVRSLEGFTQG